jgi:uncharacterized membrane protein YdbT with pleckstrin-like domain
MKTNKRRISSAFLILGMIFLLLGLATDNTVYSWAAIVFIVISLIAGGRWMRPRRR